VFLKCYFLFAITFICSFYKPKTFKAVSSVGTVRKCYLLEQADESRKLGVLKCDKTQLEQRPGPLLLISLGRPKLNVETKLYMRVKAI
jgi:hypothetical protein